jgi:arsenite-transporting ATPase
VGVTVARRGHGVRQDRPLQPDPGAAATAAPDLDLDLVLYTGKGGVGKTTTAAATALRSAELGQRTLIVSADPAHSLRDVLGPDCPPLALTHALDAGSLREAAALDPYEVSGKLFAVELDARVEVRRHWERIHRYLAKLFAHHGIEESVAADLATLPGAFELATLLAVDRAAASGAYDLVVVDCAPSASALRMSTLPEVARGMLRVLLGVLRKVSGVALPVAARVVDAPLPDAEVLGSIESLLYQNLSALRRRLAADSTAVRLVVTPEQMVIDEAARTYTDLCLFQVGCDAIVVNRVLPEVAAEEPFFRELLRSQTQRLAEIEARFAPLPVLHAPLYEEEVTGLERLTELGQLLFGDTSPRARRSRPREGLRFGGEPDAPVLRLPLPGTRPDELDVAKVGGELVVTTPRRRRSIPLPRRIARLDLRGARLEAGQLEVRFGAPQQGSPCG